LLSIKVIKELFQNPMSYFCRLKEERMKILMVCLGNICRSPLAEGILKHKAKEAGLYWTVESAGTNGYHVGEAPHHLSQKVALLNGINICDQRARRFVKEDMDRYDKIYAMADDVLDDIRRIARNKWNPDKVDYFLNELQPGKNNSVLDPWYGTEPDFHDVYKIINETCDAIIKKYGARVTS
jgi:protein-tyrosine phosphatase